MLLLDHRKTVIALWGKGHLAKARRYLADTLYYRLLSESSLSFSGKMELIIEGLSTDPYSVVRIRFWKAFLFIVLGQESYTKLINQYRFGALGI